MKVAIIGGGFAGVTCAKLLQNTAEVTLFDTKSYFEYTPSVPKLLTKPDVVRAIRKPHDRLHATLIKEPVSKLTANTVTTKKGRERFDYAVIASGVTYPIFLKNTARVFTVTKGEHALKAARALSNAHTVLIIGGGLIGVEVAGELTEKTDKKVILVHPWDCLLERNPPRVGKKAKKVLEKRGATIICGEKVLAHNGHVFTTDTGRKIKADMAFWCAGIQAKADFFDGEKTTKGAVVVNEYLQTSIPNIFCGGDISSVQEEKTAQNAVLHAKVIAHNIMALHTKQQLKKYRPGKRLLIISLGSKNALFVSGTFVWRGWLPALLKKAVEWKEK